MSEQMLNEVELFLSNELAWRKKIWQPTDFCKGEINALERLHNSLKDSRTKPQSDDTGKVMLTKEQAEKLRDIDAIARSAVHQVLLVAGQQTHSSLEFTIIKDAIQSALQAKDREIDALKQKVGNQRQLLRSVFYAAEFTKNDNGYRLQKLMNATDNGKDVLQELDERDRLRAELANERTVSESLRKEIADLDNELDVEMKAHADLFTLTNRQKEELRKEVNEWKALEIWGGTPAIIGQFIKGQQNRINATQDLEQQITDALAEWKDFYDAALEEAHKNEQSAASENDTHGMNFHQGKRSGLISCDIGLGKLRKLFPAKPFDSQPV